MTILFRGFFQEFVSFAIFSEQAADFFFPFEGTKHLFCVC